MKLLRGIALVAISCWLGIALTAQDATAPSASAAAGKAESGTTSKTRVVSPAELEKDFFSLLRAGDEKKFLAYVSEGGMNVGREPEHLSRSEVEDQITHHTGLYCKLFDSSCLPSEIRLDQSNVRACSYRELLTQSKDVRTAATEATRNGVKQAILVARVKNDNCAGVGLVDFIFNLQSDGWKLFSVP